MKKYMHWIILGGFLVALVALRVLASSSETTTMTPRAAEDWSRGQFIGYTPVKQPIALQPAPDGGVFLAWPNLDGRLELTRMGVDGEVLLDRVLPVEVKEARDPQLELGLEGRLHLLWREQRGPRAGVWYALLETDGTPVSRPQVLSPPTSRILGVPRLARDAKGHLHALWADDIGIHRVMLDSEGETLEGPVLLIPEGHSPLVQVDDGGRLHLVWQREVGINVRGVYYAVLDPEKGDLGDAEEIAEIMLSTRVQMEDLAFGLSHDTGYVLWSEYDQGFDHYRFPYTVFPLDAPERKAVELWHLRIGDGPKAISMPDGEWTPLPVALSERVIDLGQEPEPTSGRELAHYIIKNEGVAASGLELRLQITLINLGMEMGQGTAVEKVVTASPAASMKPVLAIDDRSHLHLAWLETGGFGQYRLIYASTAPKVLEEYNALSFWDVVNILLSRLFRLSLVVVSVVITFVTWAVLPLLGLVVYHLITSDETLHSVRSRIALVTVLAVEVALTFVWPPRIAGVGTTLPLLRWGIPAVAAVGTAVVTARIVRRREDIHLFATFFLFTALNSLLQVTVHLLL